MRNRKIIAAFTLTLLPLGLGGCNACYSSKPSNPDQIREKTADATAQLKDDAKAVFDGVRQGMTRPTAEHPLDVNHASKTQLMTLPGIDDAAADRIIAGRPYASEHQLLEKRIISRDQYVRIADSVTAGNSQK